MDEQRLKDRWLRYRYMLAKRNTPAGKKRFLQAFAAELEGTGLPMALDAFPADGRHQGQNLYIGDISRARKIICTYYDTPPGQFGRYTMDPAGSQKRSQMYSLVCGVLLILTGLILILLIGRTLGSSLPGILLSLVTVLILLMLLRAMLHGDFARNNQARNTSSLLAMLESIESQEKPGTAWALLDYGSYGKAGLRALQKQIRPGTRLYYLDCIGADAPLQRTRDKNIEYIFAAEPQENGGYALAPGQAAAMPDPDRLETVLAIIQ